MKFSIMRRKNNNNIGFLKSNKKVLNYRVTKKEGGKLT